MRKAYPYKYDDQRYATLGQSPDQRKQSSNGMARDEELESTVFQQSPIHHVPFNEGNSRLSDDQTYFGNMKNHTYITNSFSGTGMKPNYGSNFNTISSSAESTPHKTFKAGLMAKMKAQGNQILTGKNYQSTDSIMSSIEGGFNKPDQVNNPADVGIDNEMDEDKAFFNPMSTHDHYDLSKYTSTNPGEEILITQNIQPIAEQSDEESRIGRTGNTTPISHDARGADPIGSNRTTPYNYTDSRNPERNSDMSPYVPFENSSNTHSNSIPKYSVKGNERNTALYENLENENTFDEKTTNITGYKSYIDKASNSVGLIFKENSGSDSFGQGDNSSLIGQNLANKYQMNNLQFSQFSGSVGGYDGTNSRLQSSPTIEERGPESEEASNDSQLKISQLNASSSRDDNPKLNFEDLEQPKTGTIGESSSRERPSTLHFISNLESGSSNLNSIPPKSEAEVEEDDYRAKFKKFADKHYEKLIE